MLCILLWVENKEYRVPLLLNFVERTLFTSRIEFQITMKASWVHNCEVLIIDGGGLVVAMVLQSETDLEHIWRFLHQNLPSHWLPNDVFTVKSIPLTLHGMDRTHSVIKHKCRTICSSSKQFPCTSNCWKLVFSVIVFFLAFDFCRFCMVIRLFHPRHNGQWPPT